MSYASDVSLLVTIAGRGWAQFVSYAPEGCVTAFNVGKPFHGSEEVVHGKLTGATDTDYFYFFCPRCEGKQMLRVLDYKVVADGPPEYAKDLEPKPHRDFIVAFELYCSECGLHDFVKVSNIGWQGGDVADSPNFGMATR